MYHTWNIPYPLLLLDLGAQLPPTEPVNSFQVIKVFCVIPPFPFFVKIGFGVERVIHILFKPDLTALESNLWCGPCFLRHRNCLRSERYHRYRESQRVPQTQYRVYLLLPAYGTTVRG
jgi:hypothetical protein